MRARAPARPAIYQETHSALNWPLLACGLFAPVAAEIVFVVLGIVVNPTWFVGMMFVPLFAPAMIYISLLYRNWPTGIRIDGSAITIGAVRSAVARVRRPTVNHQSWGLFTCPWSGVIDARVVTDPAEVRRLKTSPRYYTLNNRWGGARGMTYCNIGVLTSPFMRAALVVDVDPRMVTATQIRPTVFFTNFKDRRGFYLVRGPKLSPTWIVPTRNPEGLSKVLETLAKET